MVMWIRKHTVNLKQTNIRPSQQELHYRQHINAGCQTLSHHMQTGHSSFEMSVTLFTPVFQHGLTGGRGMKRMMMMLRTVKEEEDGGEG